MMETVLPILHAKHEMATEERLKTQSNLTISLDGWTDISKNSIYAVLVLRGTQVKHFIDVLDLNHIRHTSENTLEALKETLKAHEIRWDQISAVVTNSTSVMIKFRVSMFSFMSI